MPSKHVIRNFEEDGMYHVYNRGVEKRDLFLDEQDHQLFLYYLLIYTVSLDKVLPIHPHVPARLQIKNLSSEIEVLAYCLMPNHFHLLIKQKRINGVSRLLKQLSNAYTKYFNNKYKRVGGLMQGRYKAVQVKTNEQLLHVSRYIHLNPLVSKLTDNLKNYQWSSYLDYIKKRDNQICTKDSILFFFTTVKYEEFVLDHADYAKELDAIKHLTME